MNIRPYQPADHEACLALFLSNVPLYFLAEEQPDFERFLQEQDQRCTHITEVKTRWEPRYYVLEQNGKPVTCGGFGRSRDGSHLTLIWGMVARERHHHGFGKQLLRFRLEEAAKCFPGEIMRLDTTQHSRPFFERFGFRVTLFTPNGYGPGMDRYDMEHAPEQITEAGW